MINKKIEKRGKIDDMIKIYTNNMACAEKVSEYAVAYIESAIAVLKEALELLEKDQTFNFKEKNDFYRDKVRTMNDRRNVIAVTRTRAAWGATGFVEEVIGR